MKTKIRYEALGSFRGLAALLIAVFHFPLIFFGAESPLIRHSYIVTNLFFGLSGFILMAAYGNRLSNWTDVAKFSKKRLYRLYPMYLLTTVLVLLVPFFAYASNFVLTWVFAGKYVGGFAYPSFPLSFLLADAFMLQGFGLFPELHLNFPAWSMGALFYCSILFAAISLFKRIQFLLYVAVFAFSAYVIYFESTAYMGSSHDFGIFRSATSFYAGVLAWYLRDRISLSGALTRWAPLFQTISVALVIAFVTWVGINTPNSLWSPLVWTLFILAFSVEEGEFVQAMKHPVLVWLSERSYALFLCQAVFLFMGVQAKDWIAFFELDPAIGLLVGSLTLTAYLALSLWLADLLYRRVELRLLPLAK